MADLLPMPKPSDLNSEALKQKPLHLNQDSDSGCVWTAKHVFSLLKMCCVWTAKHVFRLLACRLLKMVRVCVCVCVKMKHVFRLLVCRLLKMAASASSHRV